jgi:hypothetical protein
MVLEKTHDIRAPVSIRASDHRGLPTWQGSVGGGFSTPRDR